MPKKLRSDDDDLMEIFQQHYAELRREHSEYEDTVHKFECEVAGLRGRVDQLEELNKRLTEERDQFLECYYRLVTQFELMGGSFDRARWHHRCDRILARPAREARPARNTCVAGG
jgi:predicted nuclease with TOPRIM domain